VIVTNADKVGLVLAGTNSGTFFEPKPQTSKAQG
jgi:hypothetical protein